MAVTAVSISKTASMMNAALVSAELMTTVKAADMASAVMPTCAMPATVATPVRHRGNGAHTC